VGLPQVYPEFYTKRASSVKNNDPFGFKKTKGAEARMPPLEPGLADAAFSCSIRI
jgi:hypothetical protein